VFRIERVREAAWPTLKATRLAALGQAPAAFTTPLAEEAALSDAAWQRRAAANASDETSAGFLAFEGERPVGLVACLWQDKARRLVRLVSLWVAPAARRQGVAKALVAQALGWAQAVGAVRCEADVTRGNHQAEAFYARQGFRRVAAGAPPDGLSRWLKRLQPERGGGPTPRGKPRRPRRKQ